MRVDIYRRAEAEGRFSHLAVPEGKRIPEEATNTDWDTEVKGQDLDEDAERWDPYGIVKPGAQLKEKGYAITGLHEPEGA
ncbi:DUF6139 family protein [Acidovorax sp.]|uniref:DUF6139 family protein n=1 Tax=Acidovorax sp. TaxID=1872122 RepID=UPI002ACD2F51|nr:DUF6139 family protein [Acidovorax sp.]MDZ7864912.1 DUF6139 family protein [Acidovorax sp.]